MKDGLQKSFYEDFDNDIISYESCQYDSIIEDIFVPKQAKMIANYLLWCFSRTTQKITEVTYADVSDKILEKYKINIPAIAEFKKIRNGIKYENKAIGGYAECINEFCAKFQLPFITSKIVSIEQKGNGTKIPQIGFFKSLSNYKNVYNYQIPSNKVSLEQMQNSEKGLIIDDINNKISQNFEIIIDTFQKLNNEETFIGYSFPKDYISEEDKTFIREIEEFSISATESYAITKNRIGQSKLKQHKLSKCTCCELCGLETKDLLIASHIKPWKDSNDKEKLDTENILLLCPTHDALFDKGFITFDKKGNIKISNELSETEQALLNIHDESKIEITSKQKINYLIYHQINKFKA